MSYQYEVSVVVPLYNEEDNVNAMYDSVKSSLKGIDHEIIFVDDGSFDDTIKNALKIKDKNFKLVKFSRNYGQTSAMAAGIEKASGEYIATLDGDLQNDPSDIPAMLKKIKEEKLDIVAGRRNKRKDGMFLRKVPSLIANFLIRKTTGVYVSDYGCTLKLFRSEIAKKLELYGELHRFIPILASMHGAKIKEMGVKHHARQFGASKYGISRTIRVISDLMLMLFFVKYRQKPMHLFGTIGQVSLSISALLFLYLFGIKLFGGDIGHRPMFVIAILLFVTGVQFLSTGFIAELLTRVYYSNEKKKPYNIAEIYVGGKETKE